MCRFQQLCRGEVPVTAVMRHSLHTKAEVQAHTLLVSYISQARRLRVHACMASCMHVLGQWLNPPTDSSTA